MSMSMHVCGYKPADDRWRQMKAAWDACIDDGVDPPKEVADFFGWNDPGDKPGMEVQIYGGAARKWVDDGREGFEVDVTALPEGVRFVRFYCAW